ncbi:MAG TPA: hypothetical protein VNX25_09645, partial [Verrucomicrobiae bacterium]|nr:hypothetical protein [Verrucomicrobiae bacterium]
MINAFCRKPVLAVACVLLVAGTAAAEVRRELFRAGDNYLVVETLDDDLFHFEIAGKPGAA